jgi:cell fate regulator YaaT (PSP1 superfamily)
MTEIIGIRFRKAGRVYYFDPAGIEFKVNDYAIVETARGQEMGLVIIAPKQIAAEEIEEQLKPAVRKAEIEDITRSKEFATKEQEGLVECGKLIEKLGLPMKLLTAEYNFDGSRLTFYFSAEERVDFRKLVRELTSIFHVRVELRQVGSRDEARLVGDFGRCGRPLCCLSFLNDFDPVSIKMAKEQSLPLNPMRISGVCGRLMCCLGYECEQYRLAKEKMPREGQKVTVPMGPATVVGCNILKETVLVEMETGVQVELPLKDIQFEGALVPPPEKKSEENRQSKRPPVEIIPPEEEKFETPAENDAKEEPALPD